MGYDRVPSQYSLVGRELDPLHRSQPVQHRFGRKRDYRCESHGTRLCEPGIFVRGQDAANQLAGGPFGFTGGCFVSGGTIITPPLNTDLSSPLNLGLARFTPDAAASNPVIGSGGSRHIQVGAKLIW